MKKNIYLNIFLFLTFVVALSSCISQKQVVYFQKDVNQRDTIDAVKVYVPKIQSGDILSIYITSLNPAASSFFNPFSQSATPTDLGAGGSAPALQAAPAGILVDSKGEIELPLIGQIKLAGLTTSEARDTIKNRLLLYTKGPSVNVRLLNYKISVMGEVLRPSVYVIPNETVTLPEALAMAGDLTIYAKRENVLIVRDNNGKKEFGHVNLNNREIFTSPYYYLHSGDLVYIEQGKGKAAQSDQAYRIIPIVLSALTVIGLLIYRLK